jgi:two-component system chemotaxis response regulator CheB
LAGILRQQRDIEVTVAPDAIYGLEEIKKSRPDVVVLDLEMPRMDGLTFLEKVMAEDPLPVVVFSSLVGPSTEVAWRAFQAGAVDVVSKQRFGVKESLLEMSESFINTLRTAARSRVRPRMKGELKPLPWQLPPDSVTIPKKTFSVTTDKVAALGASTGGTEALRVVLQALPPDAPGLLIVQHMPERFTAAFAERLNEICQIEVKEAADNDRVLQGRALLAPGNRHLVLERTGGHYVVRLLNTPPVDHHRPSVDVMFQSVAQAAGSNAVGVIMTGMGSDGTRGLMEMKRAGAHVLAQDEASCVVFGMPKSAIENGVVDRILPLTQLAGAITKILGSA